MKTLHLAAAGILWLTSANVAHAQLATLGATVQRMFEDRCFSCHGDATRPGPNAAAGARPAPSFGDIRSRLSPQGVFRMIDGAGLMAVHTKDWTADDRRRVAEYITGKTMPLGDVLVPTQGRCAAAAPPMGDPFAGPSWNSWGVDAGNGRFQTAQQAGLTAADIPKLKLKWAFGFPGVTQAYAQPIIASGRVFVGSETGVVYAIDAKTGCFYWTFPAAAPVRATIVLARSPRATSGTVLYFGDVRSNMYAVDAQTGAMLWTQKIDEHPHGRITGSPTLANDRLYVPVAGMTEEAQVGNPAYECCSFRGSLVSMDPASGRVYWKSYTIAETPKPRGKNAKGTQLYGPAGASIWSAPTGRRRAYKTTDGRLLWEYNTAVPFETINGVDATGGSISGAGPAIAGGMLFVNSGYSFFSKGGNVLLAFGAD